MAFWLTLMIGAAVQQTCPPAQGVFHGGGAWSAAVCYETRPRPWPPLVIA